MIVLVLVAVFVSGAARFSRDSLADEDGEEDDHEDEDGARLSSGACSELERLSH